MQDAFRAPFRRLGARMHMTPRNNRPSPHSPPVGEKLQKVLARAGAGSRREMERWIEQGCVTIDGRAAQLGDRVTPQQILRIDGRALLKPMVTPKSRVLVYH